MARFRLKELLWLLYGVWTAEQQSQRKTSEEALEMIQERDQKGNHRDGGR